MSLKNNSIRLLSFLYSPKNQFKATYHHLNYLFPTMSKAGRRSLISYAHQQSWISKQRDGITVSFWLTSHGQHALELEMPVFSSLMREWQGEWSVVVFLQPPANDRQFRYLRTLLLDMNVVPLSRGVYLLPKDGSDQLKDELYASYRNSVVVLEIETWFYGDERSIILEKYQLQRLVDGYSGISKEINQLLSEKTPFLLLKEQQKTYIFSVFDRLYSLLQKDVGILHYYFPQVDNGINLLQSLQSVCYEIE